MNEEMKIIDLLNKKANGEEMPNRIKYENIEWYYDMEENEYIKGNEDYWLFQDYFPNNLNFMDCLNDLVEILDNMKKEITIYELLGLIKDGKPPIKILFSGNTFVFRNNTYEYENGNISLFHEYKEDFAYNTIQYLNDKVEILENQ